MSERKNLVHEVLSQLAEDDEERMRLQEENAELKERIKLLESEKDNETAQLKHLREVVSCFLWNVSDTGLFPELRLKHGSK